MSSPGSGSGPSADDADRDQRYGPADDEGRTTQNRRRSGGRTPGAHRAGRSEGLLQGFGRGRAKPDRGASNDAGAPPDAQAKPDPRARRGFRAGPRAGARPGAGTPPRNGTWP